MNFCRQPFENIEIFTNGDAYTCCPPWINNYSIGNIFKQSVEEVWNSDKAIELRKKILSKDYSCCNKNICNYCNSNVAENLLDNSTLNIKYEPVMQTLPIIVKLGYDLECNIACKFCRDKIVKNSFIDEIKLAKTFQTFILPLLKNTQLLSTNGVGDPFGSRHSRNLIKKIAETYPNIRFDFLTNGTLCNMKMLRKLMVIDRFDKMRISVSAASADTYSRIVKDGKPLFNILTANLEALAKLKRERPFNFCLNFVVTSQNYKDIPAFISFADQYDAKPCFWELRFECSSLAKIDSSWDIVNKDHPEHKLFLECLADKSLDKHQETISPILWNLREEVLRS